MSIKYYLKYNRSRSIFFSIILLGIFFCILFKLYSENAVTITWNTNAETNLVGYNVYYGNSSRHYDNLFFTTQTTSTVYGINNDLLYYFAVTATNTFGLESGFSAEVIYPEFTNINEIGIFNKKYKTYGSNIYVSAGSYYTNILKSLESFTLVWPSNKTPQFSTNLILWNDLYLTNYNINFKEIYTSEYSQCFFRTRTTIPSPPTNIIFGNTNNGILLDPINGYINLSRFFCETNATFSMVNSRLPADIGKYKFAVYSDSNGNPSNLLSTSLEIINPTNGWNSVNLNSNINLTAGNYYWLAVLSDSVTGKIYYSDTSKTLKWNIHAYGNWPNPIITSGTGLANLCIYLK